MKKFALRFWHPVRGIMYALRNDSAIQIEVFFGTIALIVLHFLFGPFSPAAQLLLLFCFLLVLITEFQNSAIEVALDKLHPERHESIGISKDLAAASVIFAAIFSLISLIFVLTGQI